MFLFINACVREASRTRILADRVLSCFDERIEEVRLDQIDLPRVDAAFLEKRDQLGREGRFDDPFFSLAKQFASADLIVIAAPYYDLSFPASLKQYLELINVVGITFRYTEEGVPVSLCKAKELVYVTSAGGVFVPDGYGFGYVRELAETFYGIKDVRLVQALGLDIVGNDPAQIMDEALEKIPEILK